MNRIIVGTSWNSTPFVWNWSRGEWQAMDNVTIGADHFTDESSLDAAIGQALMDEAPHIADSAELIVHPEIPEQR